MALEDKIGSRETVSEILSKPYVTAGNVKMIKGLFVKEYHPDRGGKPWLEDFRSKIAGRRGAESFLRILASIETDKDIDEWRETEHQAEGRYVLFPGKRAGEMSVVVATRSPREFLLLLDKYARGELSDDAIRRCESEAARVSEWARKLKENEEELHDYSEESSSLMESFKTAGIETFDQLDEWRDENRDHLHSELLSYPIVSTEDGPTTLRSWINRRHLEIIREEAKKVTSTATYDVFRETIRNRGFYLTPRRMLVPTTMDDGERDELVKQYVEPTRVQANRIVKEVFVRLFQNGSEMHDYFHKRLGTVESRAELFDLLSEINEYKYGAYENAVYLSREEIADLRHTARLKKRDLEP